LKSIPLCEPSIDGNEWKYIKNCLDDNWVSSVGKYVDRFEQMIAQYIESKYAIATVNGTAAIHISLLVAGVKPEEEVFTSTLSFIAPANAIRYIGAWPIFVDSESNQWQMDTDKLNEFIKNHCTWQNGILSNRSTKRRISAILPVHILGHPVNMKPLLQIARKYNLKVIEDSTESLGAKYDGDMSGSLGDIACFSFNGNKLITTGGGGMIVTNNPEWAELAKHLTTQAKSHQTEYIHDQIGYNYRLTNIQAAMGVAQMENIQQHIQSKQNIAAKYNQSFENLEPITTMKQASWAEHVWWLYTILINKTKSDTNARILSNILNQEKIQTRPLWQPLHMSSAHSNSQATDCSVSERLYEQAISLPCSVGLNTKDQDLVISKIESHLI